MSEITENVKVVLDRIAEAAISAGRRPEDIQLVAASKMNDADRVREAIAAGVKICGENRVQELEEKLRQNAYDGAEVHFIGHLQRNKVKNVTGRVQLIQSVDSLTLMELISEKAKKPGIIQDVLLEVNIGGEAAKSGADPGFVTELAARAAEFDGLRVRGLMCIPPFDASEADTKNYFNKMYNLFVDIRTKKYDNTDMSILSMGMSGDYPLAIACGANMVRVGTAIFGMRHY